MRRYKVFTTKSILAGLLIFSSILTAGYVLLIIQEMSASKTVINNITPKLILGISIYYFASLFFYYISIKKALNQLDFDNKKLKDIARKDQLTGALNRLALKENFEQFTNNRRKSLKDTLVILDIDDFKRINDTYGHICGDRAIKHIANIISKTIRETDQCYRIGGEEFCITCIGTSVDDCLKLVEKIRTLINNTPLKYEKHKIYLTCTYGVTEINKKASFEKIFSRADNALYEGKKSGKDKICFK